VRRRLSGVVDLLLSDAVVTSLPLTLGSPASATFNLLIGTGNYSTTWNNMKLVYWPLMGGLLHLIQREGDWSGSQSNQAPPRCIPNVTPSIGRIPLFSQAANLAANLVADLRERVESIYKSDLFLSVYKLTLAGSGRRTGHSLFSLYDINQCTSCHYFTPTRDGDV